MVGIRAAAPVSALVASHTSTASRCELFWVLVISLYFHSKKNTMSDQLKEFDNETGCPKCGSGIISPIKYT
ncbi:MAG: hypothetical protein U0V75_12885 [Ferruginibacter sp.]